MCAGRRSSRVCAIPDDFFCCQCRARLRHEVFQYARSACSSSLSLLSAADVCAEVYASAMCAHAKDPAANCVEGCCIVYTPLKAHSRYALSPPCYLSQHATQSAGHSSLALAIARVRHALAERRRQPKNGAQKSEQIAHQLSATKRIDTCQLIFSDLCRCRPLAAFSGAMQACHAHTCTSPTHGPAPRIWPLRF